MVLFMVQSRMPAATGWCFCFPIQWRKKKTFLPGMRFKSFPSGCLGMSVPRAVTFTRDSHLLTWANRLIWDGCWGLTTISAAKIARFPPLSPFTHIPYTPCLLSSSFSGIYNIRGEISLQKSRQKLWNFKCLDFQVSKNSNLETFTSKSVAWVGTR